MFTDCAFAFSPVYGASPAEGGYRPGLLALGRWGHSCCFCLARFQRSFSGFSLLWVKSFQERVSPLKRADRKNLCPTKPEAPGLDPRYRGGKAP